MWQLISAFFIGRAVGGWRYMRIVLLVLLLGCLAVGFLYALVVFNAVRNTPETHHVQHQSSH